MKVLSLVLAALMLFTVACGQLQQQHYEGAGLGALVGGIAGALLDKKNSWRGGVIGAGLGVVLGATLADISQKAAKEAAKQNKTVVYETEDQTQKVVAIPIDSKVQDSSNKTCKTVRIEEYQNGQKVSEKIECI